MGTPRLVDVLLAELDDTALDELAKRLAPRLASEINVERPTTPWLNCSEAATYLACSRDRVYDLVQLGKLDHRHDGRRLLFRTTDLDAYLEARVSRTLKGEPCRRLFT